MKRLIKFLLGLAAGATVAALVTPKSGREMREQLLAGVSGRLLPPPPEPQTLLEEPTHAAAPVATAEPEAVEPGPELVSESTAEPAPWLRPAREPAVEEPAVEEPAVEEPAVEESAVEELAVEKPAVEEPSSVVSTTYVEEPAVDDAGVGVWPEEQETVASAPEEPAWNAGVAAAVETPLYSEPAAEEAVETPLYSEPAAEEAVEPIATEV
ncbi:MAG: YtxH domain-containing protein, partial [Thermoleophilia bacterium]|nr:YtxH domain-containing protein [Thermoleophilia bacterium]